MRKKRAMTKEKASLVKIQGHLDAKEFATLIGLADDYQNDPRAKKDVIDFNGDAHSIKSGKGYWQIFLYSESRFENDSSFRAMNGIGLLMLECIKLIPDDKNIYQNNKQFYKEKIADFMIKIQEKLQEKYRLDAFLRKAIFEGSQVNYLTIKHDQKFHVFWHDDVMKIFLNNLTIANSLGNQKVLLKLKNNCGEIEMRNGEDHHHKEMKFRLHKMPITNLLINNSSEMKEYNDSVILYGMAIKKFPKKNNCLKK
jgi:hypothetical protein